MVERRLRQGALGLEHREELRAELRELERHVTHALRAEHRVWVAFWAVQRVRTTYSPARGFGLVAAVQVGSGRVVARGVIEKGHDEPHYTVAGGGTMYGPAALVNAACREECANAIFRAEKRVWCVETKRGLRVGEEVLVHYPARGQCVCGATQWD
jgi:hypothetical protein